MSIAFVVVVLVAGITYVSFQSTIWWYLTKHSHDIALSPLQGLFVTFATLIAPLPGQLVVLLFQGAFLRLLINVVGIPLLFVVPFLAFRAFHKITLGRFIRLWLLQWLLTATGVAILIFVAWIARQL